MNYTSYVTALSTLTAIQSTNADFINILPDAIDYGELRIYRELNLLQTGVRNGTSQLATNVRTFNLPVPAGGTWLVVEGVNVITPAATAPDSGTRVPLLPTTQDFIDLLGNSSSFAGLPSAYAMVTDTQLIVGPSPNGAYFMEIVGSIRPATLTSTNANTILTDSFPDLFVAASMIFMAGYMQNYGAQSDNPQMSQSWEAQYQALKGSAATEEARKRVTAFSGRMPGGTPRAA